MTRIVSGSPIGFGIGPQMVLRQQLVQRLSPAAGPEALLGVAVEATYRQHGLLFTYHQLPRREAGMLLHLGSAGLMWGGHAFVVPDFFPHLTPDKQQLVAGLVAVHEYGEVCFGDHHQASLLEFAVASLEGQLEWYLNFLHENYLLKFRDVVVHRMASHLEAAFTEVGVDTPEWASADAPTPPAAEDPTARRAHALAGAFRWPPALAHRYAHAMEESPGLLAHKAKDWVQALVAVDLARPFLMLARDAAVASIYTRVAHGAPWREVVAEAKRAFLWPLFQYSWELGKEILPPIGTQLGVLDLCVEQTQAEVFSALISHAPAGTPPDPFFDSDLRSLLAMARIERTILRRLGCRMPWQRTVDAATVTEPPAALHEPAEIARFRRAVWQLRDQVPEAANARRDLTVLRCIATHVREHPSALLRALPEEAALAWYERQRARLASEDRADFSRASLVDPLSARGFAVLDVSPHDLIDVYLARVAAEIQREQAAIGRLLTAGSDECEPMLFHLAACRHRDAVAEGLHALQARLQQIIEEIRPLVPDHPWAAEDLTEPITLTDESWLSRSATPTPTIPRPVDIFLEGPEITVRHVPDRLLAQMDVEWHRRVLTQMIASQVLWATREMSRTTPQARLLAHWGAAGAVREYRARLRDAGVRDEDVSAVDLIGTPDALLRVTPASRDPFDVMRLEIAARMIALDAPDAEFDHLLPSMDTLRSLADDPDARIREYVATVQAEVERRARAREAATTPPVDTPPQQVTQNPDLLYTLTQDRFWVVMATLSGGVLSGPRQMDLRRVWPDVSDAVITSIRAFDHLSSCPRGMTHAGLDFLGDKLTGQPAERLTALLLLRHHHPFFNSANSPVQISFHLPALWNTYPGRTRLLNRLIRVIHTSDAPLVKALAEEVVATLTRSQQERSDDTLRVLQCVREGTAATFLASAKTYGGPAAVLRPLRLAAWLGQREAYDDLGRAAESHRLAAVRRQAAKWHAELTEARAAGVFAGIPGWEE